MPKLRILFSAIISLLFLVLFTLCSPKIDQIFIDGEFNDWQHFKAAYADRFGDHRSSKLDFGKLWITNDANYLYFRIEVGTEINIQNDNEMALFLDSDNNPNTGKQVNGIGAELIYQFGNREGTYYTGSDSITISHNSIGIVMAPTVTSKQFEIAINRSSLPDGTSLLFPGKSIRLMMMEMVDGGDELPDKAGGIEYSFRDQVPLPLKSLSIKKKNATSLRIMTYNVLVDGLLKPEQFASISKILQAIQPEIIAFQEIYNHDAESALQQVEKIIPSTDEQQWYSVKGGRDIIITSRFAIKTSTSIDGNGAFLIDLYPKFESKLLLIGAHLPCCANNEGRKNEIDALMQFIRETKNAQGEISLAENTPIILLGDLNLVGDAQQLRTLLSGNIQDTLRFGPGFSPDWDNTSFADLLPYCINVPFSFTYYDRFGSFGPGRLDLMIYSDSVIQPVKKFVLFTPAMSPDSLTAYNLNSDDALIASDHLPVVADFILINN